MTWKVVAQKEYLENVRSFWIVAISSLFLLLTLGSSLFASLGTGPEVEFASLTPTMLAMQSITSFLLPILALLLTFGTIAGERESGSLGLLVAQPITRAHILLGKFLGLWGVLATALVVGIGGAGLIVLSRAGGGAQGFSDLLVFLLVTLAWGAAWVSIGILVSSWFKRRGTAIGGAILIWFFFGVIWNILVLVLLIATAGRSVLAGRAEVVPPWFVATSVLNPNAVYSSLLSTAIRGYQDFSTQISMLFDIPAYTTLTFVVAMAAWIALPLWGAYALFHRRDV